MAPPHLDLIVGVNSWLDLKIMSFFHILKSSSTHECLTYCYFTLMFNLFSAELYVQFCSVETLENVSKISCLVQ